MGNIYRHGAAMYRQTMNPDEKPQYDEPVFYKESRIQPKSIPVEHNKTERPALDSKYTRVAKFLILIGSAQAS